MSEASEIVAAEEARLRDRGIGLPPSNPDAVAHHLAVAEGPDMPDETLIAPKKLDGFTHESPIRAFTEFRVAGNVAIGKGFRPSLGHLHTYLDAMLSKEGWRFVQVILPDDASNDPTILFAKDIYAQLARDIMTPGEAERTIGKHPALAMGYNPRHEDDDFGVEHEKPYLVEDDEGTQQVAYYSAGTWWQGHNDGGPDVQTKHAIVRIVPSTPELERVDHVAVPPMTSAVMAHEGEGPIPELVYWSGEHSNFYGQVSRRGQGQAFMDTWYPRRAEFPTTAHEDDTPPICNEIDNIGTPADDPINPKHYGGTACADIGELLTANSYQILKYNWRLGEKDSPCVELGKALWYLNREIRHAGGHKQPPMKLPGHRWIDARLAGKDRHVVNVTRSLVSWCRYGNPETLKVLRKVLQSKLDEANGCTEWGRGLEP